MSLVLLVNYNYNWLQRQVFLNEYFWLDRKQNAFTNTNWYGITRPPTYNLDHQWTNAKQLGTSLGPIDVLLQVLKVR
jgi:hypothetical protein